MSRKWLTRLIAPAAVLVWIGLGWLSYQQGQLRGVVIAALTGVVIVVVSVAIWRRQRRFDQQGASGFATVLDGSVFDTPNPYRRLVQVAMVLQFEGVGVGADEERIYRIFNLPEDQHERYAPGAHLPIRVLPGDLSVIQIEREPDEATGKRQYLEARASQTPIASYA